MKKSAFNRRGEPNKCKDIDVQMYRRKLCKE